MVIPLHPYRLRMEFPHAHAQTELYIFGCDVRYSLYLQKDTIIPYNLFT